jgi:hypothetical protein
MIFAILLLIVLAGAAFWYWRSLQGSPTSKGPSAAKVQSTSKKGQRPVTNPAAPVTRAASRSINRKTAAATIGEHSSAKYKAVSIQFKECACAAVKDLAGQRFLTSAAPSIPLPACDKTRCQCSYAHHNDQRHEEDDRRSVHGLQTELYPQTIGNERRKKRRGRRKNDII